MKNFILTLAIVLIATIGQTATGDISKVEVRKDVTTYKLDTVSFRVITQTCIVQYRKVDSNGDPVGGEVQVIFQNVLDDLSTPDDESSTEFTQLISAINNGSNIKQTITNAVKIKLGL